MPDHAYDCSWHLDQYPFECDCGEIIGRSRDRTPVVMDRQLFGAVQATLLRKEAVFKHYSNLHAAKGTEEARRKALDNQRHAKDIRRITDRFDDVANNPGCNVVHIETIMALVDMATKPAGIIITPRYASRLLFEFRTAYEGIIGQGPQSITDLKESRICDVPIYVINDETCHGPLVCEEGSPMIEWAKTLDARP